MRTLDYAPAPTAAALVRPFVPFVLIGLVPTALLFVAFFHLATTGDPVDGLATYKGYHYLSVAIVISLVGWFAIVCWRAPRRYRLLFCLVALIWGCFNSYLVGLFIREVRADDPGGYYQSQWEGQ